MELSSLETQTAKQCIASALWGSHGNTSATPFSEKKLSRFFSHCAKEREMLDNHAPDTFSTETQLQAAIRSLKSDREDLGHSTAEALAIGCLPPQLVIETLKTLVLLFPLLQVGNDRSQRILRKWVEDEDLDKTLVDRHHVLAKLFAGGQPDPEDTRELLRQYPYWGAQLARLLREVDEPTAATWLERHAERRRSPRHVYKCAMAALVVTAVFGMLATVLAAVQVWISYCAWVEDPSEAMCGAKKARLTGVQNRGWL